MATPRFTWTQTEDELKICVHLIGLRKVNLESYCKVTDVFLGITFNRKILALDFLHHILPTEVRARIEPPEITFTIKKAEPKEWDDLISKESKQVRLKRRKESIEKCMEEQAAYRKRRAEERRKRLKEAQKRMWDQESEIRETIEALENESKNSAQKELCTWTTAGSLGHEVSAAIQEESPKALKESHKVEKIKKKKTTKKLAKAMAKAFDPTGISKGKSYVSYAEIAPVKPPKTDPENLPPIRSFSNVGVSFTKAGIGPKREGAKEPPVFTKSQLPKGEVTPNTMTEKHPLYLRDKGIKHFNAGEFNGAENVFSEAHKIDEQSLEILLCLAETRRQLAFALRHDENEKGGLCAGEHSKEVKYTEYFQLALSDVITALSNIPKPKRPEKREHLIPAMVGVALRALLWNELEMSSTGIKNDTQTFVAHIQSVCKKAGGKEIKWGVWDNCFNQLTLEVQRLALNLDQ